MQKEIFIKVKDPLVLGNAKHELEDSLRIALIVSLFVAKITIDIEGMTIINVPIFGNVPTGHYCPWVIMSLFGHV